ncbi:hypothetical protein LCGC14_0484740 [marine sediment metagenome]|uniref:Uncharacterized protein n=1 Tax=marine sediment metagenome TaxID=412755 RepID=A0A0F9UV95_9ZZZZ
MTKCRICTKEINRKGHGYEGVNVLKEIQREMKKQDNRATADPMFIVFDWEKVPSNSDCADNWEYVDGEGASVIGTTKEHLLNFIKGNDLPRPTDKELHDMDGDELLEWLQERKYDFYKFYYIEKREFRNVFFTEKAADKFIEQNRHHFTDKVHTYVVSLYRNPEMQYIRDRLERGLFIEKEKS